MALAEAASGAPRISPKAVATSALKARTATLSALSTLTTGNGTDGFTPIVFGTVDIDTFGWLPSPYSKFQPTTAGTYRLQAAILVASLNASHKFTFRKNGVAFGEEVDAGTAKGRQVLHELVYLNGSTDYIEVIATFSSTTYTPLGYAYLMAELAGAA